MVKRKIKVLSLKVKRQLPVEQNVFNLMQNDEIGLLWKKIYQLHQKTKIYLLTAEEISENGDALIQPLKEHRDAYDYIVRIFASTSKKVPEGYDYYSYIKGNLEKAYGHEYRAFFDTADWLAYNLRHNLRERINAIPYNKRIGAIIREKFLPGQPPRWYG